MGRTEAKRGKINGKEASPAKRLREEAIDTMEETASKRYVFWNNKGGVGKSTLLFHCAVLYARAHEDESVLVVDMCPQASVSSTLLTESDGQGKILRDGGDRVQELSTVTKNKPCPKTIVGYLMKRLAGEHPPVDHFITHLSEENSSLPSNLYLVCGDQYLDLIATTLDAQRRVPDTPVFSNWVSVTYYLRDLIGRIAEARGGQWTVFIDTNPAFTVYTQLAIAAGNRLVIPFNADDYSRRAVDNLLDHVYGRIHVAEPYQNFNAKSFASEAGTHRLNLPRVHLLIHNRATVYSTRAANAYAAKWRA